MPFFGLIGLVTFFVVFFNLGPVIRFTIKTIEIHNPLGKTAQAEVVEPKITLKEIVLGMVAKEGIDTSIADKIISCESNWKVEATHKNKNGSTDYGIWQLNTIHKIPVREMLDPIAATYHAINLIKSDAGFRHWTCYKKIKI